jgi:hypothetical protein
MVISHVGTQILSSFLRLLTLALVNDIHKRIYDNNRLSALGFGTGQLR